MTDAPPDRISLILPRADGYFGVASLVLGGLAGRVEMPYDRTDDLQLAVLSALEAAEGDTVTIEVEVTESGLDVSLGPLATGTGEDRALLHVLGKLVDGVSGSSRDGREWLTLSLSRPTA